jgi:hypothetical protein
MLKSKGKGYETGVTISQSKKTRSETVLGICHIGLGEAREPFFSDLHELVVGLCCNKLEVSFL